MKAIIKQSSFLILLFIGINVSTNAQEIKRISDGKYLVIGSFQLKNNAIGFTNYVKKMNLYNVELAYDQAKGYYRVYIKTYGENQDGYDDVWKMRKETEFDDTWYMVIGQRNEEKVVDKPEDQIVEEPADDPVTYTPPPIEEPIEEQNKVVEKQIELPEEKIDNKEEEWVPMKDTTSTTDIQPAIETPNPEAEAITKTQEFSIVLNQPEILPQTYEEEGGYKIFCNTYYTKNYKEIKGNIEVINPKSNRLLRTIQSQELVKLRDPRNGNHSIQLIANIFGYKKVQHDFDLTNPFDSITVEFLHFKGDTLIANFPLRRYDQGDIATMYNVFFFKDAAVMMPNSIYEINSLMEMLRENEDLKIKIHGHTNSNERGKIIILPEGASEFFSMNQEVEEGYGSAKELSLRRSEVIRNYLISQDIAPDRMEVIGWGGKRPIYHKMDKLAVKNVRVEIEILEK
jgi:outer membrane protein OmpA-like peptidoglycan-associated protein